jgi:hypothetical protein
MFTLTHSTCEPDDIQLSSGLINIPKMRLPDQLTYTKDTVEYTGVIAPQKYFTAAAYVEYLKDNIDKIQFRDNPAVYELVNIRMTQVIRDMTLADLKRELDAAKVEIKELRKTIATLSSDGYECIHTYEYPSWATYEEFKKLPGWKYFEAAENYKSHVYEKKINPDSNGASPCIKLKDNTEIQISDKFTYCQSGCKLINMVKNTTSIQGTDKINEDELYNKLPELIIDSLFYNNYIAGKTSDYSFRDNNQMPQLFRCSINTFVYQNKKYDSHSPITDPFNFYIKLYVYGWLILNIDDIQNKRSYVAIEIINKKAIIKIMATKKRYKNIGSYSMSMPKIKEINLNGIFINWGQ